MGPCGQVPSGTYLKDPVGEREKHIPARPKKGWIDAFLAMEKHCDGSQIANTLRRFAATAAGLVSDSEADLRKKVLERYPYVLRAAAEQAVKDFCKDQREEDLMKMLGRPRQRLVRLVCSAGDTVEP